MSQFHAYYIVYRQKRFIEFNVLLTVYSTENKETSERSKLYRLLIKHKIGSVRIKNQRVWNVNDVLNCVAIVQGMKRIQILADALEEE